MPWCRSTLSASCRAPSTRRSVAPSGDHRAPKVAAGGVPDSRRDHVDGPAGDGDPRQARRRPVDEDAQPVRRERARECVAAVDGSHLAAGRGEQEEGAVVRLGRSGDRDLRAVRRVRAGQVVRSARTMVKSGRGRRHRSCGWCRHRSASGPCRPSPRRRDASRPATRRYSRATGQEPASAGREDPLPSMATRAVVMSPLTSTVIETWLASGDQRGISWVPVDQTALAGPVRVDHEDLEVASRIATREEDPALQWDRRRGGGAVARGGVAFAAGALATDAGVGAWAVAAGLDPVVVAPHPATTSATSASPLQRNEHSIATVSFVDSLPGSSAIVGHEEDLLGPTSVAVRVRPGIERTGGAVAVVDRPHVSVARWRCRWRRSARAIHR